ncbi:MAG: Lactate utilization protein [Phycisphaerales bacterium]|nr:Lactate utilization protein [Phycisphaerales bacterium]
MNDPSNVLGKVRRSLGRTAPLTRAPVPPSLSEPLIRLVLSDIGLPQLFEKKALENKIGVTPLRVDDLAAELVAFLHSKHVKTVAVPKSAFLDRIGAVDALRAAGFVVSTWDEMTVDDMYDVDASVTDVWKAVAETGSLVVRASPEHGRCLSLIPPLHVAIVEPKNCVADLIDLFETATASGDASAFTIITGPSKTSDIEMNLVIGVHGPEKVHVFLLA